MIPTTKAFACPTACVPTTPPDSKPKDPTPPDSTPKDSRPPTDQPPSGGGSGYSADECPSSLYPYNTHKDVADCVSIKPTTTAPARPRNLPDSFWFQESLVDTVNCHEKRNSAGGCSCCSYYRASPYKSKITYNSAYNTKGFPCKID
jgi:hypothetical protein